VLLAQFAAIAALNFGKFLPLLPTKALAAVVAVAGQGGAAAMANSYSVSTCQRVNFSTSQIFSNAFTTPH